MTCLVSLIEEERLISITLSQSSSFILNKRPSAVIPALLIRISIDPKVFSASLAKEITSFLSLRLVTIVFTSSPNSNSNFDKTSCLVPDKINFAPLDFICFAIDIPIPPVAPVIKATLPSKLNIILLPQVLKLIKIS